MIRSILITYDDAQEPAGDVADLFTYLENEFTNADFVADLNSWEPIITRARIYRAATGMNIDIATKDGAEVTLLLEGTGPASESLRWIAKDKRAAAERDLRLAAIAEAAAAHLDR
jgi:hypothetical protein